VALERLGAHRVDLEGPDLARRIRESFPGGVDAVLELVGNSTILNSLAMVRRGGRVCLAGFLGGLEPIPSFSPLLQMPSGVHFSFFGSFMFGSPEFPLSDVPLQTIVDRATTGAYQAKPAAVFRFEEIRGSTSADGGEPRPRQTSRSSMTVIRMVGLVAPRPPAKKAVENNRR
jgi:NADPH:quinone reductase